MTSGHAWASFFFFFVIFLDQLTKRLARDVLVNTGVSFGLLSHSLLTVGLIVVFLAVLLKFGKDFFQASPVATGLFFGGALSNLLDRLLYGGVRDFLPVPLLAVRNNLADWAILLALLWLFFPSIPFSRHSRGGGKGR